jgi:hypothetical protein
LVEKTGKASGSAGLGGWRQAVPAGVSLLLRNRRVHVITLLAEEIAQQSKVTVHVSCS